MGEGTLTIYSSSAGSGKTFQLTVAYLTRLFSSAQSYRRMLAVTFTNRATAEMKERILGQLSRLAKGDPSAYLPALISGTGKPEGQIRSDARYILQALLNDYSRFQVNTIDSFFQKILRAFARERGLHSGFTVELDHNTVLTEAVDNTIASASEDDTLRRWLISYVNSNLGEEKSWNLKNEITSLAGELFRESYKTLSADEKKAISDKQLLSEFIATMKSVIAEFENTLKTLGSESQKLYLDFGLSDDMFYYKGNGVPSFIRSLASGEVKDPNSRTREIMNDPPRWCTGPLSPELHSALEAGLEAALVTAITYFDDNITWYRSARAIHANIYSLGILSDVLGNIRKMNAEENRFLLADTGEFIHRITAGDQAPFIYEKTGSRLENFMIDEFQDTSVIQWENFLPLIENSMSEGHDNLVVGDVKQSIYRWRNSNWRILGCDLKRKADRKRYLLRTLDTNWRSLSNIIKFNNLLFTRIPEAIDREFDSGRVPVSFRELYSEAVQKDPAKETGGYIRLELVDENETKWKDAVLEKLPSVIEALQGKGFKASDFGIIVRDNNEGAQVIRRLIEYSNSVGEFSDTRHNFNVISNDSLLIGRSYAVAFLLSVLAVLNDPHDIISRAVMLRYYLLATESNNADTVPLLSNEIDKISGRYYPEGYESFMQEVRQFPLFEMCERIISFFGINKFSANSVYLNAFQDLVLGFGAGRSQGLQAFLEWWDSTGSKKSVVLPEYQDAIRVLTIHKAKGLEYKVVILPFISWNLDHKNSKQPVLWVRPAISPFNATGIVPVRYRKELENTIFADDYIDEKYSAYIDNINLLYVALTRARNVIYGFIPASPRANEGIARVLTEAVRSDPELSLFFDGENKTFELGEIGGIDTKPAPERGIEQPEYHVSFNLRSLKIRLYGGNYFQPGADMIRERINYGRMMHELFQEIITAEDVKGVLRKKIVEGILSEKDAVNLEERINALISSPLAAEWFSRENDVLTEQPILLPSGVTRRPDRIIFRNGKATIVDFKFGSEDQRHIDQVSYYRRLMNEMGYLDIEAYLWYVDNNRILNV